MEETFQSFRIWLGQHYPSGLRDLNPPVTDAELSALERALGFAVPTELAQCLRLHNGQRNEASGLFEGAEFLSTTRIADEWSVWKELLDGGDFEGMRSEPDRGVRDDWWNPKWLPFTSNGAGDHYCIDSDPAVFGVVGQVITMWHDFGERQILAYGLSGWLATYVSACLRGDYFYSGADDCIIHVDER
jgi:cell wall assembly regulator SMI1